MRVAILSDIHGNIVALEAVLKDLREQGGVDIIFVAGDMFVFGPAPDEVLLTLQELPDAYFLLGNTERYLWEKTYPAVYHGNAWQDGLLISFVWTAERLGYQGLHFIEALPRFQVAQEGGRKLLVVHGSPRSDEEGLTATTQDEDVAEMPVCPKVAVLACGHTHIPMDRLVGGMRVVNVGSVGLPFDGDPRACYAIVTDLSGRSSASPQIELRRVAYNVEQVVGQLFAVNHPAADTGAFNLRTARSIGSGLIYTPEMRQLVRDKAR
jgi:putative phosphoesterase